jgi:hypothetical protein
MLLRASGELEGSEPDLHAMTDATAASGVPGGDVLLAWAEAAVTGTDAAIASAREGVRVALGDAATVDAAGVIGNFQRMVRIADGCGIPLDGPAAFFAAEMVRDFGIDRFASARNTPPITGWKRVAARLAQPLLRVAVRRFAGK